MKIIPVRQPVIADPKDQSFWLQDIKAGPATQPLYGKNEADIVIIGGGYTGLWTALRLHELAPEKRITILEAGCCGSGASGRNGGQVHTWYAEIDALAAVVGEVEARRLCAATAEIIDELERLQNSGQIDMDLRLDGWLWTASSLAQEGSWDKAVAMTQAVDESRFRKLTAKDILQRTGSAASYTGVIEDRAGSIQPAKLVIGLRNLAIARGITVHERSAVQYISPDKTCCIHTGAGQITATKVILATNAWLAGIPELRQKMFVVQSQIIATEPIPDMLDQIGWRGGAAICDSQRQVLYYQRSLDGRVIFGHGSGRIAFRDTFGAEFNRSNKRGQTNKAELHRTYPELKNTPITHDWAGPIDCTADHMPMLGHLENHPNIFFGMGFNGSGITQTPIAGRILASLALGLDDEWSRSGLVNIAKRKRLPPEPLRYIGGRLIHAAIRRRNAAEIQNRHPGPLTRIISNLAPGHD